MFILKTVLWLPCGEWTEMEARVDAGGPREKPSLQCEAEARTKTDGRGRRE